MLIKLLPDEDKEHLIALAKLLAHADKPLLWDGKTQDEITSDTDTSALSIEVGELEEEVIADLKQSLLSCTDGMRSNLGKPWSSVVWQLIDELMTVPLSKVELPESRQRAAVTVLQEISEEKVFDNPSFPKIVLFELMLIALRDGVFSEVERALLKEFQRLHELDDFIFDDLLERAESLNAEISKTIALVLE